MRAVSMKQQINSILLDGVVWSTTGSDLFACVSKAIRCFYLAVRHRQAFVVIFFLLFVSKIMLFVYGMPQTPLLDIGSNFV